MSNVVLFFKYESNECCEKYKILKIEKKINKKYVYFILRYFNNLFLFFLFN